MVCSGKLISKPSFEFNLEIFFDSRYAFAITSVKTEMLILKLVEKSVFIMNSILLFKVV